MLPHPFNLLQRIVFQLLSLLIVYSMFRFNFTSTAFRILNIPSCWKSSYSKNDIYNLPYRRITIGNSINPPATTTVTEDGKTNARSMDEVFMKLALRHAQNAVRKREVPIGAVLVDQDNTVLASGKNSIESSYDATAHAEIECLRRAAKLVGNWRLQNCTLYTTLEPCAMCFSAIQSFRVKRVVYGTKDHRLGACGSWIDLQGIKQHPFHPRIEITGGVLAEDSKILLKRFFQNLRQETQETGNRNDGVDDRWNRGYGYDKN